MENTGDNTARGPKRDPATGQVSGGNPGNKGGTGRPTNELRAGLIDLVGKHGLKRLEKYLRGKKDGPFFKALEIALKYGPGTKIEVDTPASPLIVGVTVGPEVAAERAAEAERKEAADGVG